LGSFTLGTKRTNMQNLNGYGDKYAKKNVIVLQFPILYVFNPYVLMWRI